MDWLLKTNKIKLTGGKNSQIKIEESWHLIPTQLQPLGLGWVFRAGAGGGRASWWASGPQKLPWSANEVKSMDKPNQLTNNPNHTNNNIQVKSQGQDPNNTNLKEVLWLVYCQCKFVRRANVQRQMPDNIRFGTRAGSKWYVVTSQELWHTCKSAKKANMWARSDG